MVTIVTTPQCKSLITSVTRSRPDVCIIAQYEFPPDNRDNWKDMFGQAHPPPVARANIGQVPHDLQLDLTAGSGSVIINHWMIQSESETQEIQIREGFKKGGKVWSFTKPHLITKRWTKSQ